MRNLAIPAHVVVLFRRVVNAVSTLSISQHYAELESHRNLGLVGACDFPQKLPTPRDEPCQSRWEEAVSILQERWDAARGDPGAERHVKMASISLPWWPSLFSSSTPRKDLKSSPVPEKSRVREKEDSPEPEPPGTEQGEEEDLPKDTIHKLLINPALSDPLRTPRYPIVLCHGLYGFDARGPSTFPSMRMNYWANVLHILRGRLGAEVIVTSVPGTGNISSRSARLNEQLKEKARGRGVNFLAHSMGGLDCRHLITHLKPTQYTPLSLTSVATPHRGSPFMDWCVENIGIGKLVDHEKQLLHGRTNTNPNDEFRPPPALDPEPKQQSAESSSSFNFALLPSSFTTLLLSVVDSPAYSNLTSAYLNEIFNPATPDDPKVKYFSVAGRVPTVGVLHPFWFPKMIVDNAEVDHRLQAMQKHLAKYGFHEEPDLAHLPMWADEREWGNDGLVTVQSAKWGEFLGVMDGCDHWEMRGARGIEFGVDLPAIPAIGLGVNLAANSSKDASSSQMEKSYIAEWTRFLTGWKKDVAQNTKSSKQSSATPSQSSEEKEVTRQQRENDYQTGDHVVRSSTERLSVVVDWLVDQIPSPQALPVVSKLVSASDKPEVAQDVKEPTTNDSSQQMKRLAAEMVACTVAPSRSSIPSDDNSSASTPEGRSTDKLRREVKKMMEGEQKRWKKNELETKADLERFYVSLARKVWDEGL